LCFSSSLQALSISGYSEISSPVSKFSSNSLAKPPHSLNGAITATVVSGDLSAMDWSDGPYFIKRETDPSGGTNYTISGTSQLLSVPYALHSGSAGILAGEITESQISDLASYLTGESDPLFDAAFDFAGALTGDLLQFDGTKWVKITPDYAEASHAHYAADITDGSLPVTRGGTVAV
jgi:hypothetical protein